ncbi:MBL fold metallo-hydrolase [Roseibium marinum]|nr:MBL fold metallo-hydrolase [Roseibium marinum]
MRHDRDFDPNYGIAVEILPGVRRLTAKNSGPFTFFGTNTYLLGTSRLAVVDPGPADEAHVETILKAASGASVEAIVVSHTHVDHSPAARLLKEKTGAPIIGCGIHKAARELMENEINPLDASGDREYAPDRQLHEGDVLSAAGMSLQTIETPGHTANHLCFALAEENLLLSADHVMGWSTSIVAPPDGSMRDYMDSIDKLLNREEQIYLPGHGGVIHDALSYVGDLKQHRLNREASVLRELAETPLTIPQIVVRLYADVDPALHRAAGLSVFAHLEDLAGRGLVSASPALSLTATFTLRTS